MTDEQAKAVTKQLTDAQLDFEIRRRAGMKRQKEVEDKREKDRIFNLPENVAARQAELEKSRRDAMIHKYKNQDLNEEGVWEVYGESPLDSGGDGPFIGKFQGKFGVILEHALIAKNFFSWGVGGRITKALPETIVKL